MDDHHDLLRMIAEVDSPALKACFDAPLAHTAGVTDMRAAASDIGALQVLSHYGGEYDRDENGHIRGVVWHRDGSRTPEHYYADFVRGMADIGYERVCRVRVMSPVAADRRRHGRHRVRRSQRAAGRRVYARADRRGGSPRSVECLITGRASRADPVSAPPASRRLTSTSGVTAPERHARQSQPAQKERRRLRHGCRLGIDEVVHEHLIVGVARDQTHARDLFASVE